MSKIYSQVMCAGKMAFTSGQISLDSNGNLFGKNDIKAQTSKTLENVINVLNEKGFSKKNITSLTIYLQDIEKDFNAFNEAYVEFFNGHVPSRATVGATLFKPEFLIEIKAIAHLDTDNTI